MEGFDYKRIWAVCWFIAASLTCNALLAQNFSQNELDFADLGNVSAGVTSLMYGPDGRLYVAEYPGTIKILTIQRNAPGDYQVTAIETLTGVKDIVNHDDDGTACSGTAGNCTSRETTGLTVAGTPANPVIYVTSSDFRIGAGSGGGNGDVDLDTNSGVITRFTWTGSSWEVVDIVRGLPRSEENHATNGLEFATINGTDYLIVASGGHTNAGGPSTNFVYQCEYALSGAILSVNLDMLEGMPILDDNGRSYIYDLPTLDDPTRANANGITDPDNQGYNGIDINDPWGGNDGLNQAIIDPSGPVQIYSPGYRNAYDIVLTESGALYATDNGANGGWGGFPVNEGGGSATNDYDSSEPGSQSPSGGEQVDNVDHLQLITTNVQTYNPGTFYGGHPNPVRANPGGAGLFTAPGSGLTGAVFRTQTYDPNGSTPGSTTNPNIALPANWPPVQTANAVEGDWRGPTVNNPDGPEDNPIATWGTNTNGIDEYTASNFSGAMQGDLLAGHHSGVVRRVELQADGTLQNKTDIFFSGIGGNALGITCNGDNDIFPGTVWTGTLNGKIVVFEPQDFVECLQPGDPGYDANADADSDGYTNGDEVDNGTDHCNGGSQPQDFDKAQGGQLISDLNDPDDDFDGINDAIDSFQLGNPATGGSDAFIIPVANDLFNDQQGLGGYLGLGMTGLMNNGDTGANWLNWLDDRGNGPNPDDVLGGAPGLMTMHMTDGTALGGTNDQHKGFQYGVQSNSSNDPFTVVGGMVGFTGALRLYGHPTVTGGELGFFIGDGTQSNYIKFVVTTDGFTALQEINDVPQTPISATINVADRPNSGIRFYFVVDPATGQVSLEYMIDDDPRTVLGTITAQGSILQAIQQSSNDLAVGFIGTSNTPGAELEGTWDFLNVEEDTSGITLRINAGGPALTHVGNQFLADQYFVGGKVFVNNSAQVPDLYKTERSALPPQFSYDVPLSNGDYTVILHFAEIYWGATGGGPGGVGQRIFDVWIENTLVLDNYDITADVGAETVVTKTFNTTINDGVLNVDFSALASDGGVDEPKLSAIEILGNSSGFPDITINPISDQFNTVGESSSINVVASGGNPSETFNYTIQGQPAGISINSTTGLISGTIDPAAATGGPLNDGVHNVTMTATKPSSAPANAFFTWTITNGLSWTDKNEDESYTARHECSFVQAGDKFFLMGGRENAKTVDVYDYTTNTWNALTDSAPQDFNHFQATELHGLIWIIGAFQTNAYPNELPADNIWIFDPSTNNWLQGPAIPANRKRGSAGLVAHNDKLYIIGGNTDGHDGGYVPWFDEYDPVMGTWTPLTDAPRARDHFHAVTINGKLYAASGRLSGGPGGVFAPTIPEVDVYDFASGTWSTLPSGQNIPTQRAAAAAVNFNNKLIVVGGEANGVGAMAVTEEYDPVAQTWISLSDMNHARHGTQAIVSGNGVYILGGSPNQGGGNQKNMEYLGTDSATGIPSAASVLGGPSSLAVPESSSAGITLDVSGGNVGIFISSMEITGPDAQDFSIVSGDLQNALLPPSSSHALTIALSGTGAGRSAILTINHGASLTKVINLSSTTGSSDGVTSFTLIDADTDTALFDLFEGQQVDIATLPTANLNVRANTNPAVVGSVFFELTGTATNTRNENAAPYALFGDSGGDYLAGSLPEGGYALTATAYNGSGQSGGVLGQPLTVNFSMVTGGGGNQPPTAVAEATPQSGDAPLQVTFTGSNSTDDIGVVGHAWDFKDGNTSTEADPTHTFNTAGTYDVELTVTDGGGLTDTDVVTIMVNDPNQPPTAVAEATPQSGDAPLQVTFTGSNSTDDVGVTGHAWDFMDGSTSTEADPTHTFNTAGTYDVELTVTDGGGLTDTDVVTITVNDSGGNQAPTAVAEATPLGGDAPLQVTFTGSNSTDDIGVVGHAWDFKDGNTSTEADPTHTFDTAGTYDVELTVTDGGGLTDTDVVTITVNDPTSQGVASFTLIDADTDTALFDLFEGQQVDIATLPTANLNVRANTNPAVVGSVFFELTGTATNTRNENAAPYALFGDSGGDYLAGSLPEGGYALTATAYNGSGQSGGVLGQPLTVNFSMVTGGGGNQPPTAVAEATPQSGDAPLQVTFTGSNSTDDIGVVGHAWDFKDGNTSTEADPTHTFNTAGTYDVELTVTDGGGLTDTDVVTIMVNDPNQPPTAVAEATPQSGDAPLQVTFTGSNSTDDVGVTGHAWDFMDGSTSTEADPTHTFNTAGTYDVELTVTDGGGLTDTDVVTITVNDSGGNQAPTAVAEATPLGGDAPLQVTFTGSNSTDDIGVVGHAWDFKDGNTSTEADPTHTFDTAGTYDVELTVTDGGGLTDTDVVTITVNDPTSQGVASFTLIDADTDTALFDLFEGQQVDIATLPTANLNVRANTNPAVVGSVFFELTGTATNTRNENAAPYALFGDSGGDYLAGSLPEGGYALTATAYNGSGQSGGVLGQPLTVNFSMVTGGGGNQPPTAVAGATPQDGDAPLQVTFTGSNSTDDMGIVNYAWDFMDGNTSSEADPTHTFNTSGTYDVELTVTDGGGLTDTDVVTISVNDSGGNQVPVVINPGTQNDNEGDTVSLQIIASDESSNLIYSANNLPPNLSINPNTGLISGNLAQSQPSGAFLEENGLVIIEAESGTLVPNWSLTNLDGETGIIAGSNHFNDQNGGTIPYEITINTPGVYRFLWNSFYSGSEPSEENDNWLRFPNTGGTWFFGYQGTPASEAALIAELEGAQNNIVFPIGSPRISASTTPNGSGGNGFFKIYKIGGASEAYDWQAHTSDNDSHHIYVRFENAGTYTFEISERSLGHAIDRIALYKVDGPSYSGSQLDAFPESASSGGTQGASANSPYNVAVTVTDDGVPQESTTIQFDWIVGTGGGNPNTESVESFTLVNADTDSDLFEITDGMQIQESTVQGLGLNIRANTTPSVVGSVSLSLSGPVNNNRTENGAPYALFGDSGGDYFAATLPVGNYTLSATPYPNPSLGGTPGQTLTVQFAIVAGGSARLPNGSLGEDDVEVLLSPNPTSYEVEVVSTPTAVIEKVYIFDIAGRLVKSIDIDSQSTFDGQFSFDVLGIEDGIYIVQMWSGKTLKVSEHKLIIRK